MIDGVQQRLPALLVGGQPLLLRQRSHGMPYCQPHSHLRVLQQLQAGGCHVVSKVAVTVTAGAICLLQQDLQQQGRSVVAGTCCPVAVGIGKQEEGA